MDSPTTELHTLRDWLRWGVSRFNEAELFFGHGTDNAFDEAAWLILHALHLPPDRLDPFLDTRLTLTERQAVFDLLRQRVDRRVPAAYLTGEAWLQGVPFTVDERVIVPRSLIAEVIADGTIDAWLPDRTQRVRRRAGLAISSRAFRASSASALPSTTQW